MNRPYDVFYATENRYMKPPLPTLGEEVGG
jgi:hypothetical protein